MGLGRAFRRILRAPERLVRHIIPHRHHGGSEYVEYEEGSYSPEPAGYNNDPALIRQLDELKAGYKAMNDQFRQQLELYKNMQNSYNSLEKRYNDSTDRYNKLGETLNTLQGAYDKTKYDLDERTRQLGNVQGDLGLLKQVNNDRGALQNDMIKEELDKTNLINSAGIDTKGVNFVNAVGGKKHHDDDDPLKKIIRGI